MTDNAPRTLDAPRRNLDPHAYAVAFLRQVAEAGPYELLALSRQYLVMLQIEGARKFSVPLARALSAVQAGAPNANLTFNLQGRLTADRMRPEEAYSTGHRIEAVSPNPIIRDAHRIAERSAEYVVTRTVAAILACADLTDHELAVLIEPARLAFGPLLIHETLSESARAYPANSGINWLKAAHELEAAPTRAPQVPATDVIAEPMAPPTSADHQPARLNWGASL